MEKKQKSTLKFRDLKIVFPRGHTFTHWKLTLISFGLPNWEKKLNISFLGLPTYKKSMYDFRILFIYYLLLGIYLIPNIKTIKRQNFLLLGHWKSISNTHLHTYKGLFSTVRYIWKCIHWDSKNLSLSPCSVDKCVILNKSFNSFRSHFYHL